MSDLLLYNELNPVDQYEKKGQNESAKEKLLHIFILIDSISVSSVCVYI